jgi:hypothetical protein
LGEDLADTEVTDAHWREQPSGVQLVIFYARE